MLWIEIGCYLLCIACVLHIRHLYKELKHMMEQLECVQEGSHITLSAYFQDARFHEIYRLLNQIQKEQEETKLLYQASEKELKDTITSLAHDLRTPLTSAMGYLQMMEESEDERKRQEYQAISLQRLQDLRKLLESLFLYTKVINQEFIHAYESIEVYPVLSECMIDLYQAFKDTLMEIEVSFADEDMKIEGNKEMLQRILQNLLANAIEHGTRFLKIEQKGQMLIFTNGLKKDAVPDPKLMFQRFYKGDPSRHLTSSGLGLTIVKELVMRLHGEIHAELADNQIHILLQFKRKEIS